jgi:DNA-binding beta-propeller fold protein YncE
MMQRIQMMSRGQRVVIFVLILGGGLMLLCALTLFLVLQAVNLAPREQAAARLEGAAVREFVTLPDDDAYPAAVAVGTDGTVYTGSYASGAIWAIDPGGNLRELAGTREAIGSLRGLVAGLDGTLYALDGLDADPRMSGGTIWRVEPDSRVIAFGQVRDETGFVAPHDIAADPDGVVYAVDRGRREVWRFDNSGTGALLWRVPATDERAADVIPTGIAYDPATETLIITDSITDTIYRVARDGSSTEILYRHRGEGSPGFDGVTVAPDGTIYAAAFGARAVVELRDDQFVILASGFRGSSDVAYHAGRLYVTNFDQRALVLPGVQPALPFALDVIDLPRTE